MAHIALFGGSFNPPHLGHVLCALYAKTMAAVDAVWVFPVADHPYGKDLAAWEHRWAMCQAAFADLPFVTVRDDELTNEGGRTITLLEKLRTECPTDSFSLIGGSDTRDDLVNWYRGTELLKAIDIIAIPRRGYDNDELSALPAVSSTVIRERCQARQEIDDLVPQAVAELIVANQLYTA